MKKLRVLALMHDYMVPPEDVRGVDVVNALWKTEYDVTNTLAAMGHDVYPLGLADELGPIRDSIDEVRPHLAFNLMEAFHEVGTFDQNVHTSGDHNAGFRRNRVAGLNRSKLKRLVGPRSNGDSSSPSKRHLNRTTQSRR